jgi:hypothetical protein
MLLKSKLCHSVPCFFFSWVNVYILQTLCQLLRPTFPVKILTWSSECWKFLTDNFPLPLLTNVPTTSYYSNRCSLNIVCECVCVCMCRPFAQQVVRAVPPGDAGVEWRQDVRRNGAHWRPGRTDARRGRRLRWVQRAPNQHGRRAHRSGVLRGWESLQGMWPYY